MTYFFASVSLVLAALSADASADCPGDVLRIHDVTLNSNGMITRTVTVKKQSDAQNAAGKEHYVSKVRDIMKIEHGDEIVLNAGLQMVDASAYVKLKLKEQERDDKGVFSTTFEVLETMVSSFGGMHEVTQKAYVAKIVSNYAGNGTYTKGCGEVIQTEMVTVK